MMQPQGIYEGDCLAVMKEWPDACFDLVVTSPPYNLHANKRQSPDRKWRKSKLLNTAYDGYGDDLPDAEYIEWQRECLLQMMRLITDSGAIFYNHKLRIADGQLKDHRDILDGFPVRQVIIWKRAGGTNFNEGYFLPTYEVIYLICKPQFKLAPKANAYGDVWEFPQSVNNPHPAAFPLGLPKRCISATNATSVLDPFCGSGTTCMAAEILGRRWGGVELSAKYAAMARANMTQMGLGLQVEE